MSPVSVAHVDQGKRNRAVVRVSSPPTPVCCVSHATWQHLSLCRRLKLISGESTFPDLADLVSVRKHIHLLPVSLSFMEHGSAWSLLVADAVLPPQRDDRPPAGGPPSLSAAPFGLKPRSGELLLPAVTRPVLHLLT